MDWSREEVEAIVADYLHMLVLELAGQNYNKTEHRRRLQLRLTQRSNGSIEFKHGNISAVMVNLGVPYIRGYQPRGNYQALLETVVEEQLRLKPMLDQTALAAVQQPAIAPVQTDFDKVLTDAPTKQHRAADTAATPYFKPVKHDYLEREAQNQSLGLAGEQFTMNYEHWRLMQAGQRMLADRIEHVSKTQGDGLGYDILSFDANGRERFIEVKTTSFGRETPFFVTNGELKRSNAAKDQFHLYRLFEFRKAPRLFDLQGAIGQHCLLDPVTYRASFG